MSLVVNDSSIPPEFRRIVGELHPRIRRGEATGHIDQGVGRLSRIGSFVGEAESTKKEKTVFLPVLCVMCVELVRRGFSVLSLGIVTCHCTISTTITFI